MNARTSRSRNLRLAGIAVYVATVACVAWHSSGRTGDLLNFASNLVPATLVALSILGSAGLFLAGEAAAPRKLATPIGCGGSLLALIGITVAALTVLPRSTTDQELQHLVGNLFWVAIMPCVIVVIIGRRLRPGTPEG